MDGARARQALEMVEMLKGILPQDDEIAAINACVLSLPPRPLTNCSVTWCPGRGLVGGGHAWRTITTPHAVGSYKGDQELLANVEKFFLKLMKVQGERQRQPALPLPRPRTAHRAAALLREAPPVQAGRERRLSVVCPGDE